MLLFSCKKEDNPIEPQPNPEEETFNLALEIGNYWIYEHYRIDSGNIETPVNRMDCTWVDRDTTINNFRYAILENEGHLLSIENKKIMRDSAGYLVNLPATYSSPVQILMILCINLSLTIRMRQFYIY